jgi:hypothetical protein
MKKSTYLLILFLLTGFSCKKNKDSLQSELNKLPPITQSGANTFGCLINGKAWMPSGFDRNPNFFIIVDPSFAQGDISINTYRIGNGIKEYLTINSDTIRSTGTFIINDTSHTRIVLLKRTTDGNAICNVFYDGIYQRKGYLKITRYYLQSGIVSGEFEVSMVNKYCGYGDTIKITNGRFDYKL